MPFVRRNEKGDVIAVSEFQSDECREEVVENDRSVVDFLTMQFPTESEVVKSDLDLVRVIEDLINLLISKNIILFTELPAPAQAKLLARKQLRDRLSENLHLLDEDQGIF